MNRIERKLFRVNEEIGRLREQERLVAGELEMHRHLADDAERDAAVYDSPVERENARESGKDRTRFERVLAGVRAEIARLERKRVDLLARLD